MNSFFINMLNMSIRAGWLVLAVVIVRFLFKDIPKWSRCILWGLVAVRLICPFTIESRLSLIPDTRVFNIGRESAGSAGGYRASEESNLNSVDADEIIIGTAVKDKYYSDENGTVSSLKPESVEKSNSKKYSITKNIVSLVNMVIISSHNFLLYLEIIWLAGVFALIVYAVKNYVMIRKSIVEAVPLDVGLNHGCGAGFEKSYANNSYDIMIADAVKTPFILGIMRPKIYLPSDTDETEMKYILAHEMAHIKRRDHIWKLLGYAILTVYCFNPLMWLAYLLFCRDLELACDERVINKYDDGEKKSYSETLLLCSIQRKSVLSCPLAFGEIAVKERIKAVMNHKKKKNSIIASIVLCVVLAVCFLTSPVTSSAMTTTDRIEAEAADSVSVSMSGTNAIQSDNLNDVFSKELRDEYEVTLTVNSEAIEGGTDKAVVYKDAEFEITDTAENVEMEIVETSDDCYTVVVKRKTIEERFKQYEDYDIIYKDALGQSGKGNVYYKGELVGSFSDINPKTGTFTYQSVDKGNINISVIYNKKGDRIGIEVKK